MVPFTVKLVFCMLTVFPGTAMPLPALTAAFGMPLTMMVPAKVELLFRKTTALPGLAALIVSVPDPWMPASKKRFLLIPVVLVTEF